MISNQLFKNNYEEFIPNSNDYIKFWKQEKFRCIEGYWQCGKYMPPQLYFYINHWHIESNKKLDSGRFDTKKTANLPLLRDIDWERAYIYLEARGFSGFELDTEYHCVREECLINKLNIEYVKNKTYIPAREYLRKIHKTNLGKPLYYNNAKNVFDLEARGGGKSMWASCIIGHNYTFDGKNEYEINQSKSQSIISAINMSYVNLLGNKVKYGLDLLKGKQIYLGKTYPSPFFKVEKGTVYTQLENKKEIQKNGIKSIIGSGSSILARTFGANIFACNGTRPNITVIDEVGFMNNIKEVLTALVDTTYEGSMKFGTIWLTGTGGEMEGSAIRDVQDIFYNPETWDMLEFEDIWENKGKCGFFVPKYYTLNDYKDDEGNTNLFEAKSLLENQFKKKLETKDIVAINGFMLNSPLVPSHAFLSSEGSKYNVSLIKQQIGKLETLEEFKNKGVIGKLEIDKYDIVFNPNNDLKEVSYPIRPNEKLDGGLVIYEFPIKDNNEIPHNKYIIATDPYQHDGKGASLGSTFVYKRCSMNDVAGDLIVAEYTGRPKTVKEYNEQVRLLCKFYNAKCLYENQFQNVKEHFENKSSLSYLAFTPNTFKSSTVISRNYGINRTKDLALEFETYSSNWLEEPNPQGGINLDYIYSINLLKELISYDGKINTDRAIAFQILIAYKIHLTRTNIKLKQEEVKESFFSRKIYL